MALYYMVLTYLPYIYRILEISHCFPWGQITWVTIFPLRSWGWSSDLLETFFGMDHVICRKSYHIWSWFLFFVGTVIHWLVDMNYIIFYNVVKTMINHLFGNDLYHNHTTYLWWLGDGLLLFYPHYWILQIFQFFHGEMTLAAIWPNCPQMLGLSRWV
jgi:hypothetical protein